MKKIITLVLLLTLAFSFSVTFASAAGINEYEKEVMNKLSAKEKIGTKEYGFPAQYITMAENFFLDYDLTEAQKNEIIPYLDEAKEIIVSNADAIINDKGLFDSLSAEDKKKLLDLAISAGKVVGLTVTYDGKNLKAVDGNGYEWLSNEPIVKVTGGATVDMTLIITLSTLAGLALVASTIAVIKKQKATAM